MGRPAIPTAIKQARGTYRPDRAARNEAKPIGTPSCPAWVKDADARKEFRRLVKLLATMNLVGKADENLIVRYCIAWVRWRRIAQTLAANPGAEVATYKDESGKVKAIQVSALHSVARSLSEELGRAEQQLGMSPAARSRITVALPASASSEPKSRFFDDSPR